MRFEKLNFLKSVFDIKDLPSLRFPEVAVVGRSNVGKSTLLNHLFKSKNLVKTSSLPGKTRALNFFIVDDRVAFVDLPGYGYASVSSSEKAKWQHLLDSYLNERESLKLLLFLLDIRRIPSEEDLQMLEWIQAKGLAAIIVFTKCDKLNVSEKALQTKQIQGMIKELPHVHYSAVKNEGRLQLISLIREHVNL